MEFYTYVNIFETKGLEYLLLLSFFVLFILLVKYLAGAGKDNPVPGERDSRTAGEKAAVARAARRNRG